MLGFLSSHSLAQNDCGHISSILFDHDRLGKGWMLSVDAVSVADGENPLSARPRSGVPAILSHKAGEVAFIPCSLPRCGKLPPPAALLKVELRPSGTTPFTVSLHHCSSCPHHSLWIFLYFFAPHIPVLANTYCICDDFMSHQLVPVILF